MSPLLEVLIIIALCLIVGPIVTMIIKIARSELLTNILSVLLRHLRKLFTSPIYFSIGIFLIGIYSSITSLQSLNVTNHINNLADTIASTTYGIEDLQSQKDILISNEDEFISKNDEIDVISGLCSAFSCDSTPIIQGAYYSYLQLASDLNQTSSVGAEIKTGSSGVITMVAQDSRVDRIKTFDDYHNAVNVSLVDSANAQQLNLVNQIDALKNQEASSANEEGMYETKLRYKSSELIFAGLLATVFALMVVIIEESRTRRVK